MDCAGPVGPGIKLIYPIKASAAALNFVGKTTKFSVPLLESSGWLKDPQNVLLKWSAPSVCDMIQVLSRLSSIKILGDWTVWYESIALDEVRLVNTEGRSCPFRFLYLLFHLIKCCYFSKTSSVFNDTSRC